jgi:hypothetical protein
VSRGLSDVAEPLGRFAQAVQEERDECRGGRFAFRTRQSDDASEVRLLKPKVERGRDRHAMQLEVHHVGPSSRNAGTLEDDLAGEERFEAAVGGGENVGTEARRVVDDDEVAGAVQSSLRGVPLYAVAEDADTPIREVSEASGPEHGSVLDW